MKILIADNVSERAVEVLRAEKSWDVVFLPKKANASLTEEIQDADALVVRSATKATAALLERATRLRVIGRAGSGVDNVDLDAATKKGIVVMNTPGGNAVSVAEHTMGLLLALARRIPEADSLLKQRQVGEERSSPASSCARRRWAWWASATSGAKWRAWRRLSA